ncbi:hypothetical protein Mesau_05936 [Mesorhizobium australicum WSM2073]|uniref:Uncharacterized protein n=3 Tax=Mesorhizobium TaxID=68287 RepID=L0KVR5_MESAW|nr:hypothetical protein Mesci_5891 [Mesorhizobium ciceri biovar biserrulae WSM1271]AEH90792.1 hypothetical protein Mesop_6461 [Mesorhizobium opportunistum WSM2075]AGB48163.1 hypothetical protein Mesau_05936 [Mesorhizobium australicum WSM2073]OBP84734.1 hypothetical protein BAE40_29730 [Mesorhizobium loti]
MPGAPARRNGTSRHAPARYPIAPTTFSNALSSMCGLVAMHENLSSEVPKEELRDYVGRLSRELPALDRLSEEC